MPLADKYIAGLFLPNVNKKDVRARVLTPVEAFNLSVALRSDAGDFYYSAWVSFLDALNGINNGFYTWATVKLYYSVFYAFRTSLALNGICTFHVSKSHYIVDAYPGKCPSSCIDHGTHKVVLKTFQRKNLAYGLLSQQIDLTDAVDWLISKRESANYGVPRFSEPECSGLFEFIADIGIRQTLNSYLAEASPLYVFDPDHAMVAYPLRALQLVGDHLRGSLPPTYVTDDEKRFLLARARDKSGSLTQLITEIKRLALVH